MEASSDSKTPIYSFYHTLTELRFPVRVLVVKLFLKCSVEVYVTFDAVQFYPIQLAIIR